MFAAEAGAELVDAWPCAREGEDPAGTTTVALEGLLCVAADKLDAPLLPNPTPTPPCTSTTEDDDAVPPGEEGTLTDTFFRWWLAAAAPAAVGDSAPPLPILLPAREAAVELRVS